MIRTANCKHCYNRGSVWNMNKIEDPKMGYFYLCDACNEMKLRYSTVNNEKVHKENMKGIRYGFEFEMENRPNNINLLMAHKWLPTRDATAFVEFKSPIYQNTHGMMKFLRTVENTEFEMSSSVGTHLNFSSKHWNDDSMTAIQAFYGELFLPLGEYMWANAVTETDYGLTHRVFGRYFDNEYFCFRRNSESFTRTHKWLDVKSNRLELRIAKFRTAKQYMQLVRFVAQIAIIINNNFLPYANIDDMNDHKAKLAGQKILRKFKKMFPVV